MIIKIDHIAYSSNNIEKDIINFSKLGYKLLFNENLPNLKIKESLLTEYKPSHNLALLSHENSFNVEILNHGMITDNQGYILFNSDNNNIIIKTDDIEDSIKFWQAAGFKKEKLNVVFTSIFDGKKLTINFVKKNNNKRYFLNDKGFNCIGLITTSIESDIKNFTNIDCKISKIEELVVNSKCMKICFIQRKENEIIELIEIKR